MAKTSARVVLVDDNPVILDLLRCGVEPLADTTTFHDPTLALESCRHQPPDLVICDYRMPGMDGAAFAQALKSLPETKGARIVLMAPKSDIDDPLRPLADLVEEFIPKPFYLKQLAAQTKKILDRIQWEKMQKQASQEGIIRGRLSEMNLIDLFQSLELGQKTCALTVSQNGQECKMFFTDGQLLHAELGSIQGDEAVYRVAGWSDGAFQIDFNSRSDKKTTTRSTQGLLMEALRLLDEQNRDAAG